MTSSRIVSYYRGEGLDDRGRSLREMQAQSLDELEHNHDYIQWLFPLPERSSANPSAPRLSAADIAAFADDAALRENLLRSLSLLGCAAYADALFACLEEIYREAHAIIGAQTFRYWQSARS